jgi:hypothetical protein
MKVLCVSYFIYQETVISNVVFNCIYKGKILKIHDGR